MSPILLCCMLYENQSLNSLIISIAKYVGSLFSSLNIFAHLFLHTTKHNVTCSLAMFLLSLLSIHFLYFPCLNSSLPCVNVIELITLLVYGQCVYICNTDSSAFLHKVHLFGNSIPFLPDCPPSEFYSVASTK